MSIAELIVQRRNIRIEIGIQLHFDVIRSWPSAIFEDGRAKFIELEIVQDQQAVAVLLADEFL